MSRNDHPLSKIRALAGEGGGGKGLAYVRAIERLEGYLPRGLRSLTRVVGTSAFALLAAVVAAGADGAFLRRVALKTPWPRFLDRGGAGLAGCAVRLVRRQGLFRTDFARAWLVGCLASLGVPANVSFEGLYGLRCCDLRVVTTNERLRKVAVWGVRTTPEARVVDAVVASMAVPIAFPAVWIGGAPHSDGGLVKNDPIDELSDLPLEQCLGLRVDGEDELRTSWPVPRTVFGRIRGLWSTVYADANVHQVPARYADRVLRIRTGDLDALRFEVAVDRYSELATAADRAFDALVARLEAR